MFKNLKSSKIILASIFYSIAFSSYPVLAFDVDRPELGNLGTVIGNIVTQALLVSGAAFVVFVAFGAWKSSMALGDPRALEGAKQTWTNAVIGALIVLLSWVIFQIILDFFNVSPGNIVTNMISGLKDLVTVVSVHSPPPTG